MPFTASPDDTESHGQEIFAAAVAGEFGEVAPYAAPVIDPAVAAAMRHAEILAALVAGTAYAGSALLVGGITLQTSTFGLNRTSPVALGGTYRCLGAAGAFGASYAGFSLFQRIA